MPSEIDIDDLKNHFSYDPETGLIKRMLSVRRGKAGKVATTIAATGYVIVKHQGKNYLAHRLAWAIYFGTWPNRNIDHENRVRTDNRISNLRLANQSQNGANRAPSGSSGIKGVKLVGRKWTSIIGSGKNQKYIGTFDTSDEAAHAYNKEAMKRFGEFASLNPIGVDK